MAFDFAAAKLGMRRVVHRTLGVSALYQGASMSTPVECKARWHNKLARTGELENGGWAEVIEGIDRIVFSIEEATTLAVERGGVVTFPSLENASFTLDYELPADGPYEQVWSVARL